MNNLPKHYGAGPNAAASAWGRPCLGQVDLVNDKIMVRKQQL